MKTKILSVLTLLVAFSTLTFAQPKDGGGKNKKEKREQIEALRVSFITQKLDLTVEEAQVFWPVYNAYQDEKRAIKKAEREAKGEKKPLEEMTDAEIETMLDNGLVFQRQLIELEEKYLVKFKEVLPIIKVAKLVRAEREFMKEVLKNYRGKGDGPHPPHPPED